MEIIKNTNFKAGRNCSSRTFKDDDNGKAYYHPPKYIVIHYTGAEGDAANQVSYFNGGNRGASAHYFVGRGGDIREYCDAKDWYAWHCGGSLESSHHPLHGICRNNNSIGIEICTHYNGKAWEFTTAAVDAAVELTKYLMQKYSIPADKVCRHWDITGKSCPRVPGWGAVGGSAEWDKFKNRLSGASADEPAVKYYRVRKSWTDADSQVGAYTIYENATKKADEMGADYAVFDWTGKEVYRAEKQAEPVSDNDKFIETIGAAASADMAKSGINAAITTAQAILESGWGKSELAVNANNLFGMKKSLSGNTWPGSTWDGKSIYEKKTKENYSGSTVTVTAEFRKYPSWADSIADHSAYLAGAKNGSALRYDGLVGEADYKRAAETIKAGGYATGADYVSKLCRLVEQYGLTRFNADYAPPEETPKQQEPEQPKEQAKAREITVYFPGYTRTSSPDDRRGSGMVWSDQDGHVILYDAFLEGSVPAKKILSYLVGLGVKEIDAIGSHAHSDHLGGFLAIIEDGRIRIRNFYCCNPNVLKLAGSSSANAKAAQEDKEYLQYVISKMKGQGAKVTYINTGDKITCGEISFLCYRKQPTAFGDLDDGHAYAYVNDGSIVVYNYETGTVWSADGPEMLKDALDYFNKNVNAADAQHHGNGTGKTSAQALKKRGCVIVIEANNEVGGPGSCGFTQYGAKRIREAGIPVWMLNADIYGIAKAGRMTWKQAGKKDISFPVPFAAVLYRVRKTWADADSQAGAYSILDNAKNTADALGAAYAVFDADGNEIYRPGEKPVSGQDTQPQTPSEPAETPAKEQEKPAETQPPKDGLFRVRRAWDDAKSQVGAYRNPKTAIVKCKAAGDDYEVYDDYGVPVYPDSYRTGYFRVRRKWDDAASQVSAHKYLDRGIDMTDNHPGFSLFDEYGRKIYPV